MVTAARPKTEEEVYALQRHVCSRLRKMVVDRRRKRERVDHQRDADTRARGPQEARRLGDYHSEVQRPGSVSEEPDRMPADDPVVPDGTGKHDAREP